MCISQLYTKLHYYWTLNRIIFSENFNYYNIRYIITRSEISYPFFEQQESKFSVWIRKTPKDMSTTRSIITDINTIDLCRCHTVDILQQDYIAYVVLYTTVVKLGTCQVVFHFCSRSAKWNWLRLSCMPRENKIYSYTANFRNFIVQTVSHIHIHITIYSHFV